MPRKLRIKMRKYFHTFKGTYRKKYKKVKKKLEGKALQKNFNFIIITVLSAYPTLLYIQKKLRLTNRYLKKKKNLLHRNSGDYFFS